METAAGNKIRPDVYLNTGKATALAVIKLMEALAEGTLTREAMELCAKHILTLILRID